MNTMQRGLVLMMLAGLVGLAGCGATNYNHDKVMGLDALRLAPADTLPPVTVDLPRVLPGQPRPLYRVGPGDVLTVVVWGRPDLGSTVPANSNNRRQVSTINAAGELELPFVGPLEVDGLSLRGLAIAVENAYADLVPSPQVEVEMVEYKSHPVLVDGQVQHPGTIFLTNTLQTVGEALAAAGGARNDGDLTRVVLNRGGKTQALDVWAAEYGHNPNLDILLQSGDKLFVPPIAENQYYVLGEVPSPGAYPIPSKGVTLTEGLARAGGLKMESASFDDILLFRHTDTDSTVYQFSYFEAVEKGDFPLMPGDRIHVSQSNVAHIGFWLRSVIPSLSVITAIWMIDRINDQ